MYMYSKINPSLLAFRFRKKESCILEFTSTKISILFPNFHGIRVIGQQFQ